MATDAAPAAAPAAAARWPPDGPIRRVHDIVHTSIALPPPLDTIVDTIEFQRLRNVKQMGVAHHVFPCANHSRFVHSLGTCHIAQLVLAKLREDVSLGLTAEDAVCVAIAALCHDIGHGPYSHLYDGPFMEALGVAGEWTHEAGSKAILARVFELPAVEAALRAHLGGHDQDERYRQNLAFIIELISPPEHLLTPEGAWVPRGRPRAKSFLFDIVSNVHDGFDVDKFDYVLRDSLLTGFGVRFSKESLLRVVENVRVLPCPRLGLARICFACKSAEELLSLSDSRGVLHAGVYQHKTVGLIEAMMVKAFVAAEPHLRFRNPQGQIFRLSNMHADLGIFCGIDDSILQMIANSEQPGLDAAKGLLRAIAERRLAQRVAMHECSPHQDERLKHIDKERFTVASTVQRRLVEAGRGQGVLEDDVYVISRRIYGGLDGSRHPMNEVLVYDHKEADPVARRLDQSWLDLRASRHTTIVSFALYVSRDRAADEDIVIFLRDQFDAALAGYGIKTDRSNSGPSPKKPRRAENNN